MSATKFPQETQEPNLIVTLPVGKHFLKLVVTDDVGAESEPDTVEITVEKSGQPVLTYIDPPDGQRGKTLEAVMVGANLQDVKSIKVFSGTQEDTRIVVTPRPGGTPERLPVTIQIFAHASLGPRTIEVTTKGGVATVAFAVVTAELPRIINLTPAWAPLGLTRPVPARIKGDHLENASDVTFLLRGRPDTALRTSIRQANTEFLDVDIAIGMEATFGDRTFSVTTPTGSATNPLDVRFQILPGIVQIGVMVLTVVAALIHLSLQFPNWLFILNALGYLALLAVLYLPVRQLNRWRTQWRWALIAYTAITIVAWLVMGDKQSTLAYVTLIVELGLVGLLFVENYQASAKP